MQVTQLKIDNNPFAKGFRDTGAGRREKKRHQLNETNNQVNNLPIRSQISNAESSRSRNCVTSSIYNESDIEDDDEDENSNNSSTEYNEPFKKRSRNECLSLVNVSNSYKSNVENHNQQNNNFQNVKPISLIQLNPTVECTKYISNINSKYFNDTLLKSQLQFATAIATQSKPFLCIPGFLSSLFNSSRENNQLIQSTSMLNSTNTLLSTNNISKNIELFSLIKNYSKDIFDMQNFFNQKSNIQQLTETNIDCKNKNNEDDISFLSNNSKMNKKIKSEEIIFNTSAEKIKKTTKINGFDVKSILK